METLKEHLTHMQKYVKEGGNIVPELVIEDVDGKAVMFVFAMDSMSHAHDMMHKAGVTAKNDSDIGEVKRIMFTSEAWMKRFDKGVDVSKVGSIADYADKKEVIVVSSLDADGKFEILMSNVIRRGKYIDFSKPEQDEDAFGDPRILKKFWEGYSEAKNERK
ncbi:hypothetical protein LCGC14_0958170 [marine sediment metagenome]|uniref:Uncharacterized protein n=1 Tax=marine sediment metagenome TaxID=412755 RepID=A0A0F9QYG9_9ZZZZ